MDRRLAAALPGSTIWLVALFGSQAIANDRLILGRRLTIADPTGTDEQRSVVGLGRETATDVPGISDPRAGGATLTVIANGGTPSAQTYVLDAGGWSALGAAGYRYSGPTGADGDPVKRVIVRATPAGVALLKIVVEGRIGTQPVGVAPPNPGTDGGFILDVAGGDRYCVAFGGGAGDAVKKDTAALWKIIDPTAEGGCPSPPTTSTSVTTTSSSSTSSSTTSSTTSTTAPPVCGNNVIEGNEACDGTALGIFCVAGLNLGCGAPGQPFECQCCILPAHTFLIPFGQPPPCCDGSQPVHGLGHFVQCGPFCGGDLFPTCFGACDPTTGTTCLPVRLVSGGPTDGCACTSDAPCDSTCGGAQCPDGQVCQYDLSAGTCGCVPL